MTTTVKNKSKRSWLWSLLVLDSCLVHQKINNPLLFFLKVLYQILKRLSCVKWVRCETSPTGLLRADSLYRLSSFTADTFTWGLRGNYPSWYFFLTVIIFSFILQRDCCVVFFFFFKQKLVIFSWLILKLTRRWFICWRVFTHLPALFTHDLHASSGWF